MEQWRVIDEVDRQPLEFVFVAEIAPQWIVPIEVVDRLEGKCLDVLWMEGGMVVMCWILDVDLHVVA